MTKPTETVEGFPFEEADLNVNELEIDRRVQRSGMNLAKVERIKKNFNPGAVGSILVSHRRDRSYIIIDGQHRWQAVRELTDNSGVIRCRVVGSPSEPLTLSEEAQLFLDTNDTSQPLVIDKFNVLQNTDGPEGRDAREISELLMAYGWKISRIPAPGNINAVNAVRRIFKLSQEIDAQPNLVHATILVITRAWGNDRYGVQAPILEGIGRMFAEYGSRLDVDRLTDVLKVYKGGPRTLSAEAAQMAAVMKGKLSMAVASLLVNEYNKGRRTKQLETWRKTS